MSAAQRLVQGGASKQIPEAQLRFEQDKQSTGGLLSPANGHSTEAVRVVCLRDYLDRHVDLLKIDIEGAEGVVLPDIADRLSNVENLFVEFHSRVNQPQSLAQVTEVLSDSCFRLYLETGPRLALQPFVKRSSHKGMDLLINIFATRT